MHRSANLNVNWLLTGADPGADCCLPPFTPVSPFSSSGEIRSTGHLGSPHACVLPTYSLKQSLPCHSKSVEPHTSHPFTTMLHQNRLFGTSQTSPEHGDGQFALSPWTKRLGWAPLLPSPSNNQHELNRRNSCKRT